ncbi:urease accessory protein [Streptomyces sp. NBC_01387]|uniref:urease accessory protein UreF n=1 Tax=unclassified Streptomyces TaxID=2593676 RepID=UPI0020240EAB|nr:MULTISPECIES: urease accessory UreF family protein [unclassified Streptomyces]MCX4553320.1 urease accessory protein [Streptomyces sp. NBC_01500]WSC24466.1 urease accessory protein [Streptomyces sp. NBC_01766]WSV58444.1 urease accessory protein [Streptomyces sp. NBC_01014]
MPIPALLTGLQLTDSAFPSGYYTLSHGLEGFQQARAVTPRGLPDLLHDLLRHSAGPADATALALAHRAVTTDAWDEVVAVEQRLHATKLGREARQATVRTGRQLLDLADEVYATPPIERYRALYRDGAVRGCQPVVAAVVHAGNGVPARQAVTCELFAFAASFVGAALRLRLTDHRRAQVVLHGAAAVIEETVDAALRRELADLGGCVPVADIMSGRHERAEARLFAS